MNVVTTAASSLENQASLPVTTSASTVAGDTSKLTDMICSFVDNIAN